MRVIVHISMKPKESIDRTWMKILKHDWKKEKKKSEENRDVCVWVWVWYIL